MLTKCHSALYSTPVSYLGISAHRPCILLEDFHAFPMKTMPEISILASYLEIPRTVHCPEACSLD